MADAADRAQELEERQREAAIAAHRRRMDAQRQAAAERRPEELPVHAD